MASNKFLFVRPYSSAQKAVFLDRDGVINVDHAYVYKKSDFDFLPGALEGVAELVRKGYAPVMITNQSGLARGYFTLENFRRLCFWLAGVFEKNKAPLAAIYFCPHLSTATIEQYRLQCNCRKPEPGMILSAAQDLNLDLHASLFIGDKKSDMQAAQRAGVPKRFLIQDCKTDDSYEPATDLAKNILDISGKI